MTQQPYKTCPNCQQTVSVDAVFCNRCGHRLAAQSQPIAPHYSQPGYSQPSSMTYLAPGTLAAPAVEQRSKVVAALFALLFGGLGIHGFYLGNTTMGIILLVASVISFPLIFLLIGFFSLFVIGVICLVQAILYLVASDAEFQQKYVVEQRWF